MHTHQARQHVDDAPVGDTASHVDRQALMGEFVDHCQALDLLAVATRIEHEVVGSDVIHGAVAAIVVGS